VRIRIELGPIKNMNGITHYSETKGIPESFGEVAGTRSRNLLVVPFEAMKPG
jgi:hypothetical protein